MAITIGGKTPETIFIENKEVEQIVVNNDIVWQKTQPVVLPYFYIKNDYNGTNTITLKKNGTPSTGTTLEYTTDGTNWTTCVYDANNKCDIISNNVNEKIYFRSSDGLSQSTSNYYTISSTGQCSVGGDLRSLLDYADSNLDTATNYCFYKLFDGFSYLTDINSLDFSSIDTLAEGCYEYMFQNCTLLTTTPELPATTLAKYCYAGTFAGCSSLTSGPLELPATTLADGCYIYTFRFCSSLTTAPEIMGYNIASGCYNYMFQSCSSLNMVKIHATTWDTNNSTGWLSGVAETGDFYALGTAIPQTGNNGVPSGWTVHTSL